MVMLEAELDEVNLYVLPYRNKTTVEGAFRALLEDPLFYTSEKSSEPEAPYTTSGAALGPI